MTKFICISGKAGSGKDTAAEYLQQEIEMDGYNVLIYHYADILKFVLQRLFGWDGVKDEYGRSLLQYVGTEKVRKKDKNYWVAFLCDLISLFPDEWDYVLIPDTRFPNEITYPSEYQNISVQHIRLERPNYNSDLTESQQNHESETALDNYPYDLLINAVDLPELRVKIHYAWQNGEIF